MLIGVEAAAQGSLFLGNMEVGTEHQGMKRGGRDLQGTEISSTHHCTGPRMSA